MDISALPSKSIKELWTDQSCLPQVPGVYFVVSDSVINHPEFLVKGTGGYFKGKDPNVSIEELRDNWVQDTNILYIGKAGGKGGKATLKKRIQTLLKFGKGKDIGHWGGRFLWQIKDSQSLLVKWCPILDEDPEIVEKELIKEFKEEHNGKRPFANLNK